MRLARAHNFGCTARHWLAPAEVGDTWAMLLQRHYNQNALAQAGDQPRLVEVATHSAHGWRLHEPLAGLAKGVEDLRPVCSRMFIG